MNLKKELKKKRTDIKRQRIETGVGPFKHYQETNVENTYYST